MQPAETHRLCEYCLEVRPIEDFRLKSAGGTERARQCRQCHNREEKARLRAKRAGLQRKAIHESLKGIAKAGSDRRVEVVCEQMIGSFGGVSGFLAAWRRVASEDMAHGGARAFRHIAAVQRMLEYVDDRRATKVNQLTDEELEEELARHLAGREFLEVE
jgi:hypothetical protein